MTYYWTDKDCQTYFFCFGNTKETKYQTTPFQNDVNFITLLIQRKGNCQNVNLLNLQHQKQQNFQIKNMNLKQSRRQNTNTHTIKKNTLQILPFLWRGSTCRAARLSCVTARSQCRNTSVPPSVRGAFDRGTAKRVKNKWKSRCKSRNKCDRKSCALLSCKPGGRNSQLTFCTFSLFTLAFPCYKKRTYPHWRSLYTQPVNYTKIHLFCRGFPEHV